MTTPNDILLPCREAFEKWLNKTIDCEYEWSDVAGYGPQEMYQLFQAYQSAWNTRSTPDRAELEKVRDALKDKRSKADFHCCNQPCASMAEAYHQGERNAYDEAISILDKLLGKEG